MSEPMDPTCAATVGCRRFPAPGLLVCRGHLERLSAMLRDIEDEAAILSAVPSMQQRPGSGGSKLASERAPARLDVLVHTDRRRGTGRSETDDDALAAGDTLPILDVLHSWARVVREERDFVGRSDVTISGERDTLSRNLGWAAAQPWVDEFYGDLSVLLGQLRAANGHRAEEPYSKCPLDVGGGLCPGDVWVQDELQPVWRRYPDRCEQTWEQAPGAAVCDTCGASWVTVGDKARLKLMVEDAAAEAERPKTEDGRRMLTAAELVAQGLVSSVSNVKVTASRLGKPSVNGHYDPDWFVKATA